MKGKEEGRGLEGKAMKGGKDKELGGWGERGLEEWNG